MKKFVIRDPIHKEISLGECHKSAISTLTFQRLRRISQNGFLSYVFPGMRHSRFEHSIGAAHLAGILFDQIDPEFYDSINDTSCPGGPKLLFERTKEAVKRMKHSHNWREIFVMAALLHDVGHGPLSHSFEEMDLLSKDRFNLNTIDHDAVKGFFSKIMQNSSRDIEHEDLSLAYLPEILFLTGEHWPERVYWSSVNRTS